MEDYNIKSMSKTLTKSVIEFTKETVAKEQKALDRSLQKAESDPNRKNELQNYLYQIETAMVSDDLRSYIKEVIQRDMKEIDKRKIKVDELKKRKVVVDNVANQLPQK